MLSIQRFPGNYRSAAVAAFICVWIASALLSGAGKPKLPEGPGKDITQRICGSCHAAEMVMGRRESRDGWSGILEDMIQRGMKGSNEEYGEVVEYLVAHFPRSAASAKIFVNWASAKDLSAGLGISEELGGEVVRYREANGNFASVDDLKKVPGIDAAAVDAKKNKFDFSAPQA